MPPTTISAPSRDGIVSPLEPSPAVPAGPQPPATAGETFVHEVGPTRGLSLGDLRELWRHRELLYFLTWRDIKVRYKQTLIGVAWAVIQPLFTVVVFTILFAGAALTSEEGNP